MAGKTWRKAIKKRGNIMGVMNLLKADWKGKVGQTVGAKWKNLSTIRTYTKPANPDTAAQQVTRTGFKEVSSFAALFTDQIKQLSALDTRGMSVRNAIISANADMVKNGALIVADLVISKGGLPAVSGFTCTVAAGLAKATASWTKVVSPSVSAKAKVVVVIVDAVAKRAYIGSALNTAETLEIIAPFEASASLATFVYLLDYRGSSKVASTNGYSAVTAPAA